MSSEINTKKRKSDEGVAEDDAGVKRQKTEDVIKGSQKVVKLLYQGEPSFEIILEPDKHQILGRTNPTLAAHIKGISTDSFLSREAIDVHVNGAHLVSITVTGSNPARLTRRNGEEKKLLQKGSSEILAPGDSFELAVNPKTQLGRYSFSLVVENGSNIAKQHTPPQIVPRATQPEISVAPTQIMMSQQVIVPEVVKSKPEPLSAEEKELKDFILSITNDMEYVFNAAKEQGFTSIQLFLDLVTEEKDLNDIPNLKVAHRKLLFRALEKLRKQSSSPSVTPSTSIVSESMNAETQAIAPAPPAASSSAANEVIVVDDKMDVDLSAGTEEAVVVEPPAPVPPPPCSVCVVQTSCIKCEACYIPDPAELLKREAEERAEAEKKAQKKEKRKNDDSMEVDDDIDGNSEDEDVAKVDRAPKPSVAFCYHCSLKKHLALPVDDVWKHHPEIVDQALMGIQRSVVEQDELRRETEALQIAKETLEKLAPLLETPGIATKTRIEHLVKERKALEDDAKLPSSLIVVMGDTGAGKSSTLNAVLGEEDILPTNGMRACTASIIEMRYNPLAESGRSKPYIGEIEFVTVAEWAAELQALYTDCISPETGKFLQRPDPESQAGISLAKIKLVYGYDIKFDDFPTADSLLRLRNSVTRNLGQIVRLEATKPAQFRRQIEKYADSTNNTAELSYWPLVKRISIMGPWEVLKSGAVLVDAPGVRDDNSARDNVVKSMLRNGNSIWIVSNIKRAVNDKTAKEMLGEGFRRMLLMDGLYSTITFIATHADQLNRTEMVKNLKLPRDTPLLEVAKARNAYTRTRIKADFKAGLEEMARNAKQSADAVRSFYLPVFTVSSFDYQKCVGHFAADGGPSTFVDPEDTEIPALKRYVYELTIRRRHEAIVRYLNRVQAFMANVEHFLSDEGTQDRDSRERIYELFMECKKGLTATLDQQLQALQTDLDTSVKNTVLNSLPTGVRSAEDNAVSTVTKWSAPKVRSAAPANGTGLHWASYRATVRRDGIFSSPAAGSVNFNQDLAEPIFRFISVNWDQLFGVQISQIFKRHQERIIASIKQSNAKFNEHLATLGVDKTRLARNEQHIVSVQQGRVQQKLDVIRNEIAEKQRDISRTIVPAVQEKMRPAYNVAAGRCGTGVYDMMKKDISSHIETYRYHMFKEASQLLIQGLADLNQGAIQQVNQMHLDLMQELTLLNQAFWEQPPNADKTLRHNVLVAARQLNAHINRAIQEIAHSELYEEQKRQQVIHEGRDAAEAEKAAAQLQHAAEATAKELQDDLNEELNKEREKADENQAAITDLYNLITNIAPRAETDQEKLDRQLAMELDAEMRRLDAEEAHNNSEEENDDDDDDDDDDDGGDDDDDDDEDDSDEDASPK
eukprot:TRINITY_DN8479_c0_g1_i1.p1 TRINITY_DN8479_c0_g1~~TRINITY_DN8479_c0_g1_i1.p1  ORF type:complete len:1374 (+),score=380.54 TRINITY_DN8479_c0_g1_i1:97-4218(+)